MKKMEGGKKKEKIEKRWKMEKKRMRLEKLYKYYKENDMNLKKKVFKADDKIRFWNSNTKCGGINKPFYPNRSSECISNVNR
ncbi:MAG: hypothetical protein ACTSQE_03335 [Candidatus Heimdallarchaeaceae archaeon]